MNVSKARRQRGVSLVELAAVSGLLLALLVVATDLSLAILARQQTHSAARAGIEYALAKGYNESGMKAAAVAANGAVSTGVLRLVSISSSDVTTSIGCGCYGVVDPTKPPLQSGGSYTSCPSNSSCAPPPAGGIATGLAPYASVTVIGRYKPIFGLYWPNLSGGLVLITATYKARVSFQS